MSWDLASNPEVTLKEARNEADKIRRAARDGIDLRQARLKERAQASTFREAFEIYFEIKGKQLSNAKHLKQWPSAMERYVFPVFGDVPIAEVTTDQVLDASCGSPLGRNPSSPREAPAARTTRLADHAASISRPR